MSPEVQGPGSPTPPLLSYLNEGMIIDSSVRWDMETPAWIAQFGMRVGNAEITLTRSVIGEGGEETVDTKSITGDEFTQAMVWAGEHEEGNIVFEGKALNRDLVQANLDNIQARYVLEFPVTPQRRQARGAQSSGRWGELETELPGLPENMSRAKQEFEAGRGVPLDTER